MVKEIRIYIEGDTQKNKNTAISLREGFHRFFDELIEKARKRNIKFRIIMGGSKFITFKDFLLGSKTHKDSFVSFLLDSDDEVGANETARGFLQKQNPTWFLNSVEDEQCHLMVQVMESWFLADIDALKSFYGKDFKDSKIPKTKNVEKIRKAEVEIKLKEATKDTKKGEYHKTRHGPEILQIVDSQKVRASAIFCQKLFEVIEKKLK